MEKQIKGRGSERVGGHDRDDDRGEPNLTQEQKANLRAQVAELSGSRILTEDQVAEMLTVVPETLQAWRYKKRYDLPYLKIGSLVRYRSEDVSAFLKRRLVRADVVQADDTTQPASGGRSRRPMNSRGASLRRGRKSGELIA